MHKYKPVEWSPYPSIWCTCGCDYYYYYYPFKRHNNITSNMNSRQIGNLTYTNYRIISKTFIK